MKKILSFLLLLIGLHNCIHAQKTVPINEQWVFFPYATGERTDKKLKVMIIGTHLIRHKNLSAGQPDVGNTAMSLDFREMLHSIEFDELKYAADYDNIKYDKIELEELQGDYLKWHATDVRENNLLSSDNTLSAMEKIRTTLIDKYKKDGYKIYQFNFSPGSHQYKDLPSSTYKTYEFEKLSPLSPLYVKVYEKGEIKNLLAQLSNASKSSTGYLTITSKDEKKDEKTNNKPVSGGTIHKMTDEEIRIDISYRKTLAESDAVEGDRLYKLGVTFYPAALQKYKQAQANYYSPDVQRRVDEITSWLTLGQLIVDGGKALDNLAEKVDPNKKTRWAYMGFNYTGFGGNYSKIKNGADHKPMEGLVAFTGHRLFISFEMRMGYYASPVYEYVVTGVSNSSTPYTIQAQNGAIGLGLSGGINIPLKSLVLYAMYGFDVKPFPVTSKVSPGTFSFDETDFKNELLGFETRTTFGAMFKIPHSKVSIGAQYILHNIKGEDDGASPLKYSGNPSGKYYMKKTTDEKYEFSNFGVSLLFALR